MSVSDQAAAAIGKFAPITFSSRALPVVGKGRVVLLFQSFHILHGLMTNKSYRKMKYSFPPEPVNAMYRLFLILIQIPVLQIDLWHKTERDFFQWHWQCSNVLCIQMQMVCSGATVTLWSEWLIFSQHMIDINIHSMVLSKPFNVFSPVLTINFSR